MDAHRTPAGAAVLYGIASCDTCRKARRWLDERQIPYRYHDLRRDGLDIQMLERWSDRTDWQSLLNRQSATWRRLPDVDRESMSRSAALAAMLEHPTLVKRPVLEYREAVSVGFVPEKYESLFSR